MRIGGVKKWMGSGPALPQASPIVATAPPVLSALAPPALAPKRAPRWSPSRVSAVEALWGAGFTGPCGARETLRLATPMGLNQSLTLMLLGGGLGGPATAIATKYGAWVESFEADAEMAALAEARRQNDPALRRITVAAYDPEAPEFRPRSVHHVLALEPLRGAPVAATLAHISSALRPHGHIVLTEMVAGPAPPGADREFAAWCRLEHRQPELPQAEAVSAAFTKQGFDVRVVEDMSDNHVAATLSGWRAAVKAMEAGPRPEPAAAGLFVTEAELWLLRIRLMRRFGFRLLRWHAIGLS